MTNREKCEASGCKYYHKERPQCPCDTITDVQAPMSKAMYEGLNDCFEWHKEKK